MKKLNELVGPCPKCGNKTLKFNNVPLTAYCWGTSSKPHTQWKKVVPTESSTNSVPEYDPVDFMQ